MINFRVTFFYLVISFIVLLNLIRTKLIKSYAERTQKFKLDEEKEITLGQKNP